MNHRTDAQIETDDLILRLNSMARHINRIYEAARKVAPGKFGREEVFVDHLPEISLRTAPENSRLIIEREPPASLRSKLAEKLSGKRYTLRGEKKSDDPEFTKPFSFNLCSVLNEAFRRAVHEIERKLTEVEKKEVLNLYRSGRWLDI